MPDEEPDEYGIRFSFTPDDPVLHEQEQAARIHRNMQQGIMQPMPRQGLSKGARAAYGQRQPDPLNRPLPVPLQPDYIPNGVVLRFRTHGQFLYAAVYVKQLHKPPTWYITGSGKWFGTNELSNEQMSEVLMRPSTSHIRNMHEPVPIIGRWT